MSRWPDNEVWEQREAYNRAPRPALIECEPLRHRCQRCVRTMRFLVKFVLFGGFFLVVMLGLFYFAR